MNTVRSISVLFAFSLLFTGFANQGDAQDEENGDVFAPPYNRIGITPLVLKPGSEQFEYSLEEAFDQVEIPQKFDGNQISNPQVELKLPGSLSSSDAADAAEEATGSESSDGSGTTGGDLASAAINMGKEMAKDKITAAVAKNLENPVYDSIVRSRLNNSKVPHRVVDSLYNADEKGRYSMDVLLERAKYNLTDAQAKRLQSTSKGLEGSVQDMKWANKILTSNYVLGFYFHDLTTMEAHYENEGISENTRTHVGYKGMVSAYLFRLDMNDSVRAVLYNKCWAGKGASEEELAKAKKAREQMDYPLEMVGSYRFPVKSKQLGKDPSDEVMEDLFYGLSTEAVKTATEAIEKEVKAFKVRSNLYDYQVLPLPFAYSKIGTKQGLQPDDRYFVYEYVADGEGGVEQNRKGVLRATSKVAVNDTGRSDSNDLSRFIQTAGWGLGKGMLIEQKDDAGISFSLGYLDHGSNARFFNARLGLRISKALNIGPSWHLYGEAGIQYSSTPDSLTGTIGPSVESYEGGLSTSGLGVGLSKEFYFLNHFQLAPYLGVRREKTRFSDDDLHELIAEDNENYGTVWTFDAGARLSLNITYWLKMTGTVGLTPISYDGTPFGEDAFSEWGSSFASLEKGEDNPFRQKRRDLRWELAIRAAF